MNFKLGPNQIAVIFIVLLAVIALVQLGGIAPHRWQTYSSPDGTFTVELPGKPTTQVRPVAREGGGTVLLHSVHVQSIGNRYYSCSYSEIDTTNPRTPDQILEAARDGGVSRVQGTVVSQNRLTVHGFPALQYHARTGKNMSMDSRIIVVKDRLYMLMAVSGAGQIAEAATINRIFDSFKPTPK